MKGCSCIDKAGSCWRDDKLSLKLDARVLETKWGEGRGLQASRVAAEVASADMTHLTRARFLAAQAAEEVQEVTHKGTPLLKSCSQKIVY
jgi:hypothetical protein